MEETVIKAESLDKGAAPGTSKPLLINRDACLPARYPYSECSLCVDGCPEKCLKLDEGRLSLEENNCSRCGFCVPACPSSVFTLVRHEDSAIYDFIDDALEKGDELRFGCRYTAKDEDDATDLITLPCLSMLGETFLADAALEDARSIHLSAPCGQCAITEGESLINRSVNRAGILLKALGNETRIVFEKTEWSSEEGGIAAPQGERYSRREFFGGIAKSLANTALESESGDQTVAEPAGHIKPVNLPLRRKRLNDQAKPLLSTGTRFTEADSSFRVISINEDCTVCQACSTACPTGAIERREGRGLIEIIFSAFKCVKCFDCVGICPENALYYEKEFAIEKALAGAALIFARSQRKCESCEKPFTPQGGETQCRACVKFKKFQKSLFNEYLRG